MELYVAVLFCLDSKGFIAHCRLVNEHSLLCS